MERFDRADEPPEELPEPGGPHAARQPGETEPRRASGPHYHRRTQAHGRWRRHERPVAGPLLEQWELAAFYDSFEEPRA